MENLNVKNIDFLGSELRAAQDLITGTIFVGVSWICNGLGMKKGMKDRQVKNIQADSLLKEGCVKFDAGVFNPDNETLALNIDYLPAWLFKIRITPKMENEMPELSARLKEYQMKAKDVLTAAFLRKKEEVAVSQVAPQKVEISLPPAPNYSEEFKLLNAKMDRLYSNMENLAKLIMDWRQDFRQLNVPEKPERETEKDTEKEVVSLPLWKKTVNRKMRSLIQNGIFGTKSDIYKYIYNYMNRNYGIVWDQEIRELKRHRATEKKPATFEVVFAKDMLRSIFDSILDDLIDTHTSHEERKMDSLDMVIAPLAQKNMDKSNAWMITYRKVYKHMELYGNINWDELRAKYEVDRCSGRGYKKNLIKKCPELQNAFKKSVNAMLKSLEQTV